MREKTSAKDEYFEPRQSSLSVLEKEEDCKDPILHLKEGYLTEYEKNKEEEKRGREKEREVTSSSLSPSLSTRRSTEPLGGDPVINV